MTLVFFGTPAWAVPALEALAGSPFAPILVVTQPRKRRGRGSAQSPSPVAAAASRLRIEVAEPESVRAPAFLREMKALSVDLFVVVAFGRIFSNDLLKIPRLGSVNLHFSLLPKYRGAAPVQWAIARGETETGVTTMRMTSRLDAGPIYLQRAIPIGPDEHAPQLGEHLARAGAELLGQTVAGLEAGSLVPREQDEARATLAPMVRAEEGRIDWSMAAREIALRIRAFDPWPGQSTTSAKGMLRAVQAHAVAPVAEGTGGASGGGAAGVGGGAAGVGAEAGAGGGADLEAAAQGSGRPDDSAPARAHGGKSAAARPIAKRAHTPSSKAASTRKTPPPGLILGESEGALLVACGHDTILGVTRVQPAGKRPMTGAEALRGRHVTAGERLGVPDASAS